MRVSVSLLVSLLVSLCPFPCCLRDPSPV